MDSIRIINLPSKTYIEEGDYIAIDNQSNGTKKVQFTNLLDDTLSQENKAADAQVTGEAIGELNININNANARINNANARIDNLIIDGEPSVKTLWTGQITLVNRTAILSESVNNFDYLDFYTTRVCRRVPVSAGSVWIDETNISDDGSVNFQQTGEQLLTFSGTTVTLSTAHIWEYIAGNTPTITEEILSFVTRIDGVKNNSVALSQEVSDIRIGNDGVTYQTAGEAVRKQFSDLKSDIGSFLTYPRSRFTSGKLINHGRAGESWTTTDNANSLYTDTAIDVSAYKGGGVITITKDYAPPSSSRYIGFVDADGKWIETPVAESELSLINSNGLYKAEIPVIGDYFVASFSTTNSVLGMEVFKPTISRSEIDDIEKYVLLAPSTEVYDGSYSVSNNIRIFSDKRDNPLDNVKSIDVSTANGFQTAIFFDDGTTLPEGWKSGEWTYNNDGQHSAWYLGARKPDNSNISAEDLASFIAGTTVTITEKTILDELANQTYFVSTSGSDNNTGLTRSTPFATIQKAIDAGAKNILVKEGVYTQGFTLNDKDGVSIILDHYYDAFTVVTDEDNPKIIIDGTDNSLSNGVTISGCVNCKFGNIEVKNVKAKGFKIIKSDNLRFDDCIAHDVGIGQSGNIGGFVVTFTNGDFYNCVAYNIGTTSAGTGTYHYDGFNIHGTGTTNFINCKAWNCEDDGISHHDACCGLIDGGEWYNCGKGGVASPTHGAKVNISNVYCHDNQVGIYADNDNAVTDRGNIILSNCVCKNNSYRDIIVGDYYKVIAINCVYDTISGANNITRFGITS